MASSHDETAESRNCMYEAAAPGGLDLSHTRKVLRHPPGVSLFVSLFDSVCSSRPSEAASLLFSL